MSLRKTHWPLTILGGGVSLINLLLPLVLVRTLTSTDTGFYKIYFLYLALIPWVLLSSGIVNGVSHWGGHPQKKYPALQASWTVLLSLSVIFLILGLTFSNQIQNLLSWDRTKTLLLIFGVFITIISNFFEESSIATGKILRGAIFSSGFDLVRNLSMVLCAYHFRVVEAVLWAHICVVSVKCLIGVTWGYIEKFQRINLNKDIVCTVLKYAFPVSIASALSVATGYSDQIVLSKLLRPEDFAIYAFGCLSVPPLLIFEQSVNKVLIPKMAQCFATSEGGKAKKYFKNGIAELAWLLIPSGVGLIVFADPIVKLLFTEKFSAAVPYLRIFSITHLFNLLPYDSVARAKGDGSWIMKRLLFFSILSASSVALCAHLFGATGALSALVGSQILMRVSSIVNISKTEAWPITEMLPFSEFRKFYGLSILGALISFAVRPLFPKPLLWFIVSGSVFMVVYLVSTRKYAKKFKEFNILN